MHNVLVAISTWCFLTAVSLQAGGSLLSGKGIKFFKASLQAEDCVLDTPRWRFADPLVRDMTIWVRLERCQPVPIKETCAFLLRRRGWPLMETLQERFERNLTAQSLPPAVRVSFFKRSPPVSAEGKLLYIGARHACGHHVHAQQRASFIGLCKQTWHTTVWKDADKEAYFLSIAKPFLRAQDHHVRFQFLVRKKQSESLGRLLPFLSGDHLLQATLSFNFLSRDAGAEKQWRKAKRSLARDEGVLWAYMNWLMAHKRYRDVAAIFALLPAKLMHPVLFYRVRVMAARELMEMGRYSQAARLLAAHGVTKKHLLAYTDLLWHQAWIWLCYLNDPKKAQDYLKTFLRFVKAPISLSRGYYWLARSYEKQMNPKQAKHFYSKAAQHKGAFYGQLAALRLGQDPAPTLTSFPTLAKKDVQHFERREMVRGIRLLQQLGKEGHAYVKTYLQAMAPYMRTKWEKYLLLNLAKKVHPSAFVDLMRAYWVQSSGLPLMKEGFPVCALPPVTKNEQAETLSIIYKETRFDSMLEGDAGERGLMQVMPNTAKAECRALNFVWDIDRLYEPIYNTHLGLAHFRRHKSKFSAIPIAISAYNAGDNAVSKWFKDVGNPAGGRIFAKSFGSFEERMLQWIEGIPFSSTRSYVQRYLEAVTIYRKRLGLKACNPLTLKHD